jgi:EAL domain-containing protein (putative c-di-GMP-specific phosphodiesterase class I)
LNQQKISLKGSSSLGKNAMPVQSVAMSDTLRAAGVQLAQGHYFSGPRSANDFKRFYADKA